MRHIVAALALLTATTLAAQAQTKPAPPAMGPIVAYQYWPTQYIQFVTGPELPYTMFILEADTAAKPALYHAILTGKDGTRTHYSNSEALTAMYKAQGEPSYRVDFAVESDESDKVGATTTARFTAHDEKPVEFRFVQGSDISEQGGGLQPVPDAPIPVFAYRELGAVAGEGTALKIGNTVSAAEAWTEISHPPYFVAYRGAQTSSAHSLVFPKTSTTWTVAKYPAALTIGGTWELDSDHGGHRTLKIEKADAQHLTIAVADRNHPNLREVLEVTRNGDTLSTDRILYMPAVKGGEKHAATLAFTPGLSATGSAGTMDLSIAKKQHIATANLSATGDAADRTVAVQFTTPTWASTKPVVEETSTSGNTITLSAR